MVTTAAAVAAARVRAAADATGAAVEEADIASALSAVCQVATNALEVRRICALNALRPFFNIPQSFVSLQMPVAQAGHGAGLELRCCYLGESRLLGFSEKC